MVRVDFVNHSLNLLVRQLPPVPSESLLYVFLCYEIYILSVKIFKKAP